MCFLKDGIENSHNGVLGEHGIEGLGVLYVAIVGTSGKCVRDIDIGDRLVFSENIAICIASAGKWEDAVRRNGVPFHLACVNSNVNNEVREGLDLDVPRLGERCTGISVGS